MERLLCEYLGTEQVYHDEDGDYPINAGDAYFWVSIRDGDPVVVRIFSPFLQEIVVGNDMLVAINDINVQLHFCRIFAYDTAVICATELVAETLDLAELNASTSDLHAAVVAFGKQLHERFGGRLLVDPGEDDDEAVDV